MSGIYFIALVPDEPVLSEVRAMKEYCAEKFESSHALRSPAHITLYPPFKCEDHILVNISHSLKALCEVSESFEVELNGYGCFKPRVIFIKPAPSKPLSDFQKAVKKRTTEILKPDKGDSKPYHPHMTIAFRDLSRANFFKAWDHFRDRAYERRWTVDNLCLLVHGDQGWSVLNRIQLYPQ